MQFLRPPALLALALLPASVAAQLGPAPSWRAEGNGGAAGAPAPIRRNVAYVTGELPGIDAILRVSFDPDVPFSGVVSIAAVETRGFGIDGIDFLPGSRRHVVCAAPTGKITLYDVRTGATLPDLVPDTDAVAVPPATPGTWPSSVLTTPAHVYYVENQFGFGATTSHRILRKPFAGGPEEVVYDGAAHGFVNFEGLEIVGPRLYFFAKDPGLPDARALVSVGLTPAGLATPLPPEIHIPGLFEAPGPGTDGSDELDFDPYLGLLFGTNIVNGELIAWEPIGGFEVASPGAAHFVDGIQVATSVGELGLLGALVDGIRSDGRGHLVFAGKAGVFASIDALGVLFDGADDADVIPLVVAPGAVSFDDLTPLLGF